MNQERRAYYSFLIRLRRVNDAGQVQWRVTLVEPGSAAEVRFADVAALCRFLARWVEIAGNAEIDEFEDV